MKFLSAPPSESNDTPRVSRGRARRARSGSPTDPRNARVFGKLFAFSRIKTQYAVFSTSCSSDDDLSCGPSLEVRGALSHVAPLRLQAILPIILERKYDAKVRGENFTRVFAFGVLIAFAYAARDGWRKPSMPPTVNSGAVLPKISGAPGAERGPAAAAQVLLDRANFSPGVIDGKIRRERPDRPITAFQKARPDWRADGKARPSDFCQADGKPVASQRSSNTRSATATSKGPFCGQQFRRDISSKWRSSDHLGYAGPARFAGGKKISCESTSAAPGAQPRTGHSDASRHDDHGAECHAGRTTGKVVKIEVDKAGPRVYAPFGPGRAELIALLSGFGREQRREAGAEAETYMVPARQCSIPPIPMIQNSPSKGVKAKGRKWKSRKGPKKSGRIRVGSTSGKDSYGIHGTAHPETIGKTEIARLRSASPTGNATELAHMVRQGDGGGGVSGLGAGGFAWLSPQRHFTTEFRRGEAHFAQ